MFNFDEQKLLEKERLELTAIEPTQEIIDKVFKKGETTVFFVGVGGSLCSEWEMQSMLKAYSTVDLHVEHAAEFTTLGNKRFNEKSLVIVSSSTGDTPEVVKAIEVAKAKGATVVGFAGTEGSPVAKLVDHLVYNKGGNSYYWFTLTARLMYLNGDFPEYDRFIAALRTLPEALVNIKKNVDAQAEAWAEKYMDEPIHYFTASGNMWGWAYCYAMCLLEEMQWMRTKSIHAGDFFHGTLEVIDRNTPVTVFIGEDESRPMAERVVAFANRVSNKVTALDTKDFALPGFPEEFRKYVSPYIMAHACERMTVHLENKRKHPKEIRRYYRKLTY